MWLLGVNSLCHATEPLTGPLNGDELKESINYPIPCHKMKAFHYVYGLSTQLDSSFYNTFVWGVRGDQSRQHNDLIDQAYQYGQKYYLVPYVDIDENNQHGSEIRYWIAYRAYKNYKLIRSSVPGTDPNDSAGTIYIHAKYDYYSSLRTPKTRFGFRINASQDPYHSTVIERKKPRLNDIWGNYIPNWEHIEVLSDSTRWQNEYAVSEICYPSVVLPAQAFTEQLGFCGDTGHGAPMTTNLSEYTSGAKKPDCLGRYLLNDELANKAIHNADVAEMVLDGVILRSLPFIGTARNAVDCKSFEDVECWADVSVGALADVGSTLVPISKAGTLAVALRNTGRVMVGAAMAGNIVLAANDLKEGRYVNAMARTVAVGFNMVELKMSSGSKVLGGRKGVPEFDAADCAPSGSTNGPRTTIKRGGRPKLCDLFNQLPCADVCKLLEHQPLDEVALQRFLQGVDNVELLYRRTAAAEQSGEVFNAIDEIIKISDRVTVHELPSIEVDINDLRRWAQGAASPEAYANKVEGHFRREVLKVMDAQNTPHYEPRNGAQINVARFKIRTRDGVRLPNINDPAERALAAAENKISIEEFHHSVGRRDGKGYAIPSTPFNSRKNYASTNTPELDKFICWIDKLGHDELERILKSQGFSVPVELSRAKSLDTDIWQQLEEVDTLISLQRSGAIVTDPYIREYEARYLYTLFKKTAVELGN